MLAKSERHTLLLPRRSVWLQEQEAIHGNPYTLSKVLGTGVVNDNPHFKGVMKMVENHVDYLSLLEAIALDDPHQRFEARVKVAATSTELDFMQNLDVAVLATLATVILCESILQYLPTGDTLNTVYCCVEVSGCESLPVSQGM